MGPTVAETPSHPPIPLPVEESRAKRLQRQQARFRDRGGIFVPSNRNTLIDILLGRKAPSPLKRRSRSLSQSPTKPKPKEFPVGGQKTVTTSALSARRTSPRKKTSKKQVDERESSEPIAGPSRLVAQVVLSKPAKKARKVKEKIDEPPVAPKRRGRPPKAKPDAEASSKEPNLTEKPKNRGRAATTSTKPAAKRGRPRKKIEKDVSPVEDDDDVADEVAVGLLLTSKLTSTPTKLQAKGKKPSSSKMPFDTEVEPPENSPRWARSKKEKGAYLELSDDETMPAAKTLPSKKTKKDPPPVRKPPDKKGKERQRLAPVEEEDGIQSPEVEDLMETRDLPKKRTRPHLDNVDDAPSRDDDNGPRKRARTEPEVPIESTDPVKKRPRAKKTQADDIARREAISHENQAFDDGDTGSNKMTRAPLKPKQTTKAEPITKKPRNTNLESAVDDQLRKDPIKPPDVVKSHLLGKASPPKKRPREAVSGEPKKPLTKRKKVSATAEPQDDAAPSKVSHTEDTQDTTVVRASSRKLKENVGRAKASKPASKQGKPPAKPAPIVVPRKPPKSVLERIKEPRPQIEDDDPDPIDFLS